MHFPKHTPLFILSPDHDAKSNSKRSPNEAKRIQMTQLAAKRERDGRKARPRLFQNPPTLKWSRKPGKPHSPNDPTTSARRNGRKTRMPESAGG